MINILNSTINVKNSILILIFISLTILLILCYKLLKYIKNNNNIPNPAKIELGLDQDDKFIRPAAFLYYLDKYYIRNVYVVFFQVILYFFITALIFIGIRLYLIGTEKELFLLIQYNLLNIKSYPIFIMIFLNYIYVMRIINWLFYYKIIKLHIYLQNNDIYIKIEDWYKKYYFGFFKENFTYLHALTLPHILRKKKSLCRDSKHRKFTFKDLYLPMFFDGIERKFIILLRKKVLKHNILRIFINVIERIISFLNIRFLTDFLYYIPHLIVICVLFYDIMIINKFYYIYYALFIFVLTTINKKIREFMYVKDPLLDKNLYEYFYGENNNYFIIHDQLEKWNLTKKTEEDNLNIGSETFAHIIDNKEEWVQYLKEDFKVYYARESDSRVETFRESNLKVRRWLIMLVFIILGILLFFNRFKYTLTINSLNLDLPIIICMFPTVIMLFINKNISQYSSTLDKYIYGYKSQIAFWFCFILQILFFILLIKNKFYIYPEYVLWNSGITIIENFTLQEKIHYMLKYLKSILEISNLHPLNIDIFMKNFNTNMTLEEIRSLIDHNIEIYRWNLLYSSMYEYVDFDALSRLAETYDQTIINDRYKGTILMIGTFTIKAIEFLYPYLTITKKILSGSSIEGFKIIYKTVKTRGGKTLIRYIIAIIREMFSN